MKRLLFVVLFLIIGAQTFAQSCYQFNLTSHWRNGPCKAVAVNPDVSGILVGNGAQIDILETPYMHPWQDRIVTRGAVEQIIIANDLAYVLQSMNSIGIYRNFASPNGEELSFLKLEQPLRRMFLVNSDLFITSDSGLFLLDVSEPYSPKIVNCFDYSGFGMTGQDTILYVGKSVLNIKNPNHPVLLDTLPMGGQVPYRMRIRDHYLYAITQPPVNLLYAMANFFIFDISDPAHPQIVYDRPIEDSRYQQALSIAVNDSLAFIGLNKIEVIATFGMNALKGAITVIDISDKAHPTVLQSIDVYHPVDLRLRGSELLVANDSKGFVKFDVSNPLQITEIYSYRTGGVSSNVFVQDNRAYLCTGGSVQIFDVSDDHKIWPLGSIDSIPASASIEPGHIFNAQAVFKKSGENELYLIDENNGLFELQANDSLNFWNFTVRCFIPANLGKHYVPSPDSSILYVTDWTYGFDVIDLKRMEIVKKSNLNFVMDMAVEDTLLAVSVGGRGVNIYGCRQPDNPKPLATIQKTAPVTSVLIHDSYLYLTEYYSDDNETRMEVYHWPDDVLAQESAKILHFEFKGMINDLSVLGFSIFGADLTCGIRRFTLFPGDTLYGECLAQTYGQPTSLFSYRIFHEKVPEYYLFLADGEDGLYRYYWGIGVGLPKNNSTLPNNFELEQNYPNPFNGQTVIRYRLSRAAQVQLSVFNLLGQKIKTLVSRKQSAGTYRVIFNAENLPSGVYIYRLKIGAKQFAKKMLLLR